MAKTDRAFRALGRKEPEVVMALLRILTPGLVSSGAKIVPDDVAPTQIDGLPPELDADWVGRLDDDEMLHVECQGYRDTGFSERALWYHLGLALRNRGRRRVRTVVLWLVSRPEMKLVDNVSVHDMSVRMTMIDLTKIPAAELLEDGRTACFASGADRGTWTDAELCRRVAIALASRQASWAERHMAVLAAAQRGRYDAMVSAMEHANLEPVIIEDLVKFGEDRGFDRGFDRGVERSFLRLFSRRLGRPLTTPESKTVEERLAALGVDRLDDVLFTYGPDALAVWLAEPSAK